MATDKLASNIVWMALLQAGNYLFPLLTFPYLTRTLGVHSFGEYGLSFAIVAYLVLVTDWGFSLSASGQVAQNRSSSERVTEIFWNTVAAKALLATSLLAALYIAVLAIASLRPLAPIMLAAGGMVIANVLTVNWCLQGFEKLGSFALAASLGRALTVPATYIFVHRPEDAWIAALIQSTGAIVGGICSIIFLRRVTQIGRPRRICITSMFNHLRDSWHLFLSVASVNFYTTTNTVVLGIFGGPSAVGIYSAADRLRAAAQGVIMPISQAAYPRSSRLMRDAPREAFALARLLLICQGSVMLMISIAMFCFSPVIIRLVAGPGFDPAIPVLKILSPIPFLVGLSNVMGVQILLPMGKKEAFSAILLRAAIINLTLVICLSWWLGVKGVALATLLSEIYVVSAMILTLILARVPFLPWQRIQNEV